LPFGRSFCQLSPLERSDGQQGASALGVRESGNRSHSAASRRQSSRDSINGTAPFNEVLSDGQHGDTMTDTERNTCGSERPKYPPAPRSGNAFAAAVFAATATGMLLIALFRLFAQ